jgi:FtsZ-binding cell division protein ZapB|tara:strand:+ start:474 stop:743 length:270 start_codon:yes stop_codon:yes gene_type:complete
MKITKSRLKRIIKEELTKALSEEVSVMDIIQYDVEDLADEGMNAKQIFNNLMSSREDLQGKGEEVKAAIAKLLKIGPQSFEDETGMARL